MLFAIFKGLAFPLIKDYLHAQQAARMVENSLGHARECGQQGRVDRKKKMFWFRSTIKIRKHLELTTFITRLTFWGTLPLKSMKLSFIIVYNGG